MSEKSGNTYGLVPYEVPAHDEKGPDEAQGATPEQLPNPDVFIDDMRSRREQLRVDLGKLGKKPGFAFPHGEIQKKRETDKIQKELATLDQEWSRLGGADIEAAEARIRAVEEQEATPGFRYIGGELRKNREAPKRAKELQDAKKAVQEARASFFAKAFPESAPAPTILEGDEKSGKQGELIEALKEAYGKGNPDEVKKIKAALNELNQQPAGSKNQGGEIGKKPSTPEAAGPAPAPTAPESADQKEELKLLGESLQKVRKEYAAARVDVESHFFKKFFGGKGRQQRLEDLTAQLKGLELAVAKLKLAPEIEKLKSLKEGGEEYAQQQEQLAQVMAAHAFEGLQETERLTAEAYDDMVEGRSKFSKLAAKAGRWFTKGGKLSQVLRTGGTGAVAGAVTASVATWPITTAVGLAGGLAVAGAVKQKVLEENLGEDRVDTSSNYQEAWSKALHEASEDKDSTSTQMEAMIEATTDGMNESSKARQEALRKKVRSSMGKFALGFGAGGAAANIMQSTVFGAESGSKTIVSEVGANSSAEGLPSNGGAQAGVELGHHADPVDFINAESLSNVGDYEYPWDWAAQEVGPENAMDYLRELGNKAAAAGHSVEWTTLPNGEEMVSVDGASGTTDVLKALAQFK